MKKILSIFTVALLILCCTACDNPEEPVNSPDTASQLDAIPVDDPAPSDTVSDDVIVEVEPTVEAALDDYYVKILDFIQVVDYYGQNSIMISFEYTNNSSESQIFASTIFPVAVQNGEELERAYIEGNDENNVNGQIKELEPGETITVDVPFVLLSEDPVEVSVTGTSHDGTTNLQKIFSLDSANADS